MVIELDRVEKSWPGPPPVTALAGVSFRARSGETVAITGPSGSGKSTLLNLMGCLDRPSGGRIAVDGRDLSGLTPRERADFRARSVGFVFQMHHLLPQCTLLENVLLPIAAVRGLPPAERRRRSERAKDLLDRVGLAERLDARPGTLSGGECQRAATVRALVNEPALLLADEPTGSLDAASARAVAEVLFSLAHDAGTLLVVATHSPDVASGAGRRFRLEGGTLA